MQEMKRERVAGTNWKLEATGMFICPHGNRIKEEGVCPRGCVSPIVENGFM